MRGDGKKNYAFVLNYLKTPAAVILKRPMKDLLTGRMLEGECALEGYGALVLEMKEKE